MVRSRVCRARPRVCAAASHAPPVLARAQVLDENRVLATDTNCEGCSRVPAYSGDPAADVGALALRDRNHASVFAYSLCNGKRKGPRRGGGSACGAASLTLPPRAEAGCGNGSLLDGDVVINAKQAAYTFDGSRVVGANMGES